MVRILERNIMQILEAVQKHKGKPFMIPDANRMDLPEFCLQMGYKVGVEIGVDKAKYLKHWLSSGLKMYGVDPWRYYGDYAHPRGQERLDFLYKHSSGVVAEFGDKCTLIRKTSMEAVEDFEDESIDFVYIDGHHGFKYVAEDIWEWTKKVKKGGMISGHDFALTKHQEIKDPWILNVKHVVIAWTECFGIDNWYVIGAQEAVEGEKRDTFRSWFWIKK
jgi:hypothetical protein